MITRIVMAKLSPTMEEGTIVRWAKNEGDPVKVGEVLAEIETDKANMEMEALSAGVLRKILVPAGTKAPLGALIAVVADPGDDIAPLLAEAATAPKPTVAPVAAAPAPAAPPAPVVAAAPAPGAAAAPAPAPAAPTAPAAEGGRMKASPLARSIAAQRGIPLDSVTGSGPGGRIVKRDIESFVGAGAEMRAVSAIVTAPTPGPAKPAAAAAAPPAPVIVPGQELPLSNMRRTIARRLAESKFSAPHFYVTVEIDMDRAVALREQLREAEVKLSYNDFVVRACALALRAFPLVNASWAGEKIVTHADVNVGVAVALPDGLMTPVVRQADRKGVGAIAAEIRELAQKARDRKIRPEEYTGSTFTVSNLGMYDVVEFTAIINPPDSAILAVGAVRREPVVDGEQIRPGHRMRVTLSSDHRVIDGALAAQFLGEVRRLLENPLLLMV
jgi:pyruvate dehydrogenase E2 component (dihydrolipoamide acetyltransferase)